MVNENFKYTRTFWRWLFLTIILFWKDPDVIDALIYFLTK